MFCSFLVMLLVNVFTLHFSSIALMIIAAAVSLGVYWFKDSAKRKVDKNDIS